MEAINNTVLTCIQTYQYKNLFLSNLPNIITHIQNLLKSRGISKKILFTSISLLIEEVLFPQCHPALFIYSKSLEDISKYLSLSLITWSNLTTINDVIITSSNINQFCHFQQENVFESLIDFDSSFERLLKEVYTRRQSKAFFSIKKCYKKMKRKNHMKDSNLVSICKIIMANIKEQKTITSTELTNRIFNQSTDAKKTPIIYKKIQKRVYDTVNILKALNVIKKEKDIIQVVSRLNINEINKEEKEIKELKNSINQHKCLMLKYIRKLFAFKNLIDKNKKSYKRLLTGDKIYGEFFIIKANTYDTISLKQSANGKRLVILSNNLINITTHDQIMNIISPMKASDLGVLQSSLSEGCYDYMVKNFFHSEENNSINLLKKKQRPLLNNQTESNCLDKDACIMPNDSFSYRSSTNFYSKN